MNITSQNVKPITFLRIAPVTTLFVGVILVVYLGQILLAGDIAPNSAYRAIDSIPTKIRFVLLPWLHSSHSHIFKNLLSFVVFGVWAEQRHSKGWFLNGILTAGYLTAWLPNFVGIGGFGLGVSGITFAFLSYFAMIQLFEYLERTNKESPQWRGVAWKGSLMTFGLVFGPIRGISQYLGYVPTEPGAAVGAHLTGVVIGIVAGIYCGVPFDKFGVGWR